MKPVPFDYIQPETWDEVIQALASTDNAKILAGGQSLVPLLNMRLARPDALVSLRHIPAIDHIDNEGPFLRVGAMVVQERFRCTVSHMAGFEALREGMEHIGHPQTRSTGTVAGSIAHADPSAELPLLLQIYRGAVDIMGPKGRRQVHACDLFLFPYTTLIEPDEALVSTIWPNTLPGTGSAFAEISRRRGDFALVAVACQVRLDEGGRVEDGVLGAAGVAGTPVTVDWPSELRGLSLSRDAIEFWIHSLDALLDPPDDLEASSTLRRRLTRHLAEQTVRDAQKRARGDQE